MLKLKFLFLSLLIFSCLITHSQILDENLVGYYYNNGQIFLNPGQKLINFNNKNIDRNNKQAFTQKIVNQYEQDSNKSFVRYKFKDPYSTSLSNDVTGNGLFAFVGWAFNLDRISCYNNLNSNPVWEYNLPNQNMGNGSDLSGSSSGDYVAASALDKNIYLFNGITGILIWNYEIPSTFYHAGQVAITNSGDIIIGSLNKSNYYAPVPAVVLGFNKNSNIPIWQTEIPLDSTVNIHIQNIAGIRISGNDSLAIVSHYYKFYVIKVSTGQIIYSNWNNPYYHNNSGFQYAQGISGDGSIIAIANYYGYVRVYKWNGNTYEYFWEDQEPPGERYNWIQCVNVSYDGSMIAAGTLNFIDYGNNIYNGKVKFYRTYSGNYPIWSHSGDSEGVHDVSFSKNGKILCAATGGSFYDRSLPNLLVFKTSANVNVPIFAVSDSGSFFACSASDDGTTVIGSGDKVHINHAGMGGMYYNLYIDTSAEPIGITANEKNVPEKFYLSQNYPNPFNPKTTIKYSIPKAGERHAFHVQLKVYDIGGRELDNLVDEEQIAGTYEIIFEGTKYSSGIYFYSLLSDGNIIDTKKMLMLK
jgi:hypothetical protein